MSDIEQSRSGGGAATTAGTTFQEDVTCYLSTLILAESGAEPPTALLPGASLSSIVAETAQPIDDLIVETSVGGVLYFQAKTSLSLSDDPDSEFAKVCNQFVRQRFLGARPFGGKTRLLDQDRDRFVLVVGHGAPATITNALASVLAKTKAITNEAGLSELDGSLTQEERNALAKTLANIRRSWISIYGTASTVQDELSVLHLIHVLQLDLRVDGNAFIRAKDLLRQVVIRNPDRVGDAWNALVAVCRTFGPKRMGGDLAFLRAELQRRAIPLRSVPSFDEDIELLRKYTRDRLEFLRRLSVMEVDGERVKIAREVVEALKEFAEVDHAVVIGEPGAGKSGCIHDLADQLLRANTDVVLLAADMLKASSPESLASDMGLSKCRSLVDVLQNWSGEKTGFLLVDALDAARSGMNLRVLCQILREVREKAPRWRIVASIREYDLRTSPDVQDLFRGKPHTQFNDTRFPTVRHIRIGRLSPSELLQVTSNHKRVRSALTVAPVLAELVTNPFNLSLLCKLLDNSVSDVELGSIQTQVGLLDLYWNRRVETDDRTGRLVVLGAAVDHMVANRNLYVPQQSLASSVAAKSDLLESLLRDGVLVELAQKPRAAPIIGFAHNILFDYGVCRLWLDGLSDAVVTKLSDKANHDLLLAIRPSIVMAFEELWFCDDSRQLFWQHAHAFEQAKGMRLIGRIIAAGVAAQQFRHKSDVQPLLDLLRQKNTSSSTLLRFTIQAAITQQDSGTVQRPLIGEGAPEWMVLAAELCAYLDQVAWEVRSLLWDLSRGKDVPTQEQAHSANKAAIALLRFGLRDPRYHNVVRIALEVGADTIASDPETTVSALAEVLQGENITIGAHEWLHPMAERLQLIAKVKPEFALQVVDVVFATSGDRNAAVPMGGKIFSLTMNKHDLIRISRHDVQKVFPEIWEQDPVTATRIVLRVMKATAEEERSEFSEPGRICRISFRGGQAKLQPDASHIWTAGEHNRHEEWYGILSTFQEGLTTLSQHEGGASQVERVLDVLRDEADLAVVWNTLIKAAAQEPATLGKAINELLAATDLLAQVDTCKAAGDLIEKVFSHLSRDEQLAIEAAIVRIPATSEDRREYAEYQRNRMLGCIPIHLIQSPELRKLRAELDTAGGPPPNEPDFSISTTWGGGDEDWWLRQQGVEPAKAENAPLLKLSKSIKTISVQRPLEELSVETAAQHLALLGEAETAVQVGRETGADPPVIEQVVAEIISACEHLAATDGLRRDMPLAAFIRATLLRGATDKHPMYRPEDDEKWDREHGASWGSPSPRVDAAIGLMRLAASFELVDQEILENITRLAADPVPAVRFQVLSNCILLYRTATDLMWSLVEKTCASEARTSILMYFATEVLLRLPPKEFERLESRVRVLYRRCRRNKKFESIRRACATFYLRAALWRQDLRATRYVNVFADRALAYPNEVNTIIGHCRTLIRYNESTSSDENKRVRLWAFSFLTRVVNTVLADAQRLREKNGNTSLDQWPKRDVEDLRQLHYLAHHIAKEVYFGTGASEQRNSSPQESEETGRVSDDEKARLLSEGNSLFDALCNIEFVESAYDVLQTLEFLIGTDSSGIILRIATIVRRAERDGIQYESLAADLIVRIVERYLSEYGNLFQESSEARTALLDILDVFVGAGWPGATRLTFRLGEVFR